MIKAHFLNRILGTILMTIATAHALHANAADDDRAVVAALDLQYQAAVKRNDAVAMDRILHTDYALVLGNGTVVTRDELIREAQQQITIYSVQDEEPGTQVVRMWGDTAVVTAKLRIAGTREGKSFDRVLWFSDTYVRTPDGWRYAFAQASLPLAR